MSTIGALSSYQQYEQVSPYFETEKTSKVQKVGEEDYAAKKFAEPSNEEIEDKAIISDQAKALYEAEQSNNAMLEKSDNQDLEASSQQDYLTKKDTEYQTAQAEKKDEKASFNKSQENLSQEEKEMVTKLEKTDANVKAHEAAHLAASGGLSTSGASYEFETGPDGKSYAVAGEVSISYQKSSDPEENLENAEKLKTAALAPADPSSTDRSVARSADAQIAVAQKEMQQQNEDSKSTENGINTGDKTNSDTSTVKNSQSGSQISENSNPEKKSETTSSIAVNTAESIINPSAQAIVMGSVIK